MCYTVWYFWDYELGCFQIQVNFLCLHFQIFRGNKNAYNYAAIRPVDGDITARAVRFIPLNSVVQTCMRVQLCGKCKEPFFLILGAGSVTVV